MFETELVLWLQSFSSEWLTSFMVLLTRTGNTRTYFLLALVVAFGFDFRIGFIFFQVVLWNTALAGFLKNLFALPRPAEIDAAVELLALDSVPNTTPLEGVDGDHFFDLPEPEAIEYYRTEVGEGFGFPSRHVSMTTSVGVGAAMLLRSRRLTIVALAYVALVALSRMYLGRHFLADVLGGFLLGLTIVFAVRFVLRSEPGQVLLRTRSIPTAWSWWSKTLLVAVFTLPPLLLAALEADSAFTSAGRLLGANAAFAILFLQGVPAERHTPLCRLARVGLALLLYFGVSQLVQALSLQPGVEASGWRAFSLEFVPSFAFLLGTVWIGSLLGLYQRRDAGPAAEPKHSFFRAALLR
jgi:membrane-associated phospholipid phosphatase